MIECDQLEIAKRADQIFERKIRPTFGGVVSTGFVAIDVDSEDFELDERDLFAIRRLRSGRPNARVWLRKTDSPYARILGAMQYVGLGIIMGAVNHGLQPG